MKTLINPCTIANTVRMGARSRRPKAVFLASDQADIALVKTLLTEKECRIIPTHSRENAAEAFGILVKSGWEGVFTAVNTHYKSITDQELLGQYTETALGGVSIEGPWEEVLNHSAMLTGHRVRVTVEEEETREYSNAACIGRNRNDSTGYESEKG
jgi:hypothetical protein